MWRIEMLRCICICVFCGAMVWVVGNHYCMSAGFIGRQAWHCQKQLSALHGLREMLFSSKEKIQCNQRHS